MLKLFVPSQIAVTMPRVMAGNGLITIVMPFEVAVVGLAQAAFEVITTVMTSPSAKGTIGVKATEVAFGIPMAFDPFLFH